MRFKGGTKMNKVIGVCVGLVSVMAAYGWNIVVENQTEKDVYCQILPRMDIGARATVDDLKLGMMKVMTKQVLQFQLPVWQENLNPYIVFVMMPEQKAAYWTVQLKDHSQLRLVSEDNNQLTIYSRVGNEQWVKVERKS